MPTAPRTPAAVDGTDAAAPTRIVDDLHAISAPARAIPPSRCRQPPRIANNTLMLPATRARLRPRCHARRGMARELPGESLEVGTLTRARGHARRPRLRRGAAGHAHTRAGTCPRADSPGPCAAPVTHTRTPIHATRAAHNGRIKPLCAALCFLIPSLVCGTEGGWADTGRGAEDEWWTRAGGPAQGAPNPPAEPADPHLHSKQADVGHFHGLEDGGPARPLEALPALRDRAP